MSLKAGPTAQDITYPVLFGTTRKPIAGADGRTVVGFSEVRDSVIHYGQVSVEVPAGHEVGSLGDSLFGNWGLASDPELKVVRVQVSSNKSAFIDFARGAIAPATNPQDSYLVVFIHGYNNSFEAAAKRAAQLGVDLGVPPNNMFLFSWASRGSIPDYTYDEATIDASEIYLRQYLETVIKIANGRKIHLVAHSMGNRALLRVVSIGVATFRQQGVKFGQIILAAADVDRDVFAQLGPNYLDVSDRTTVYLSPYDFAVRQSVRVHDAPRAGCGTAPQVVIPGIDNIVSTERESFPYHAYFAETVPMLSDIKSLILKNKPARSGKGWQYRVGGYWIAGPPLDAGKVLCKTDSPVVVKASTAE
ncbi:alpha/beta hydrolase [Caballeronia sp. S22]|uniref:alpha/beta hydrolase n=1 Tax=Caballeronia sp. S22 TaxID=3137182 RepID=UPI00353107F5